MAQFAERVAPPEREWAVRTRLAMRHPSLLARQLANHATLERDLAEAVAARPGPASAPVRPIVLAAGFLSSLRIAMRMWIEEDLTREPHGGDRRDPGRDGARVRVSEDPAPSRVSEG